MVASEATLSTRQPGRIDEEQLVADVSGLVSPPTVCAKIFEVIRSPHASAQEIGETVRLDANLAARLLKIVNSSYYGFPSRIDTVSRAVTILGLRDLSNLVLAISAVRSFSRLRTGLVPMEVFWKHSILSAAIARQLAKLTGEGEPERLFVCGLLHDIGSLIIYAQLGSWVERLGLEGRDG